MKSWTIALMATGLLAAGCGGEKSGSGEAAAEKIGVQACDDYIGKMDACMAKMTEDEKRAMQSGFKDTREAWKQAAAKGGTEKERLQPICEAALASMPAKCK